MLIVSFLQHLLHRYFLHSLRSTPPVRILPPSFVWKNYSMVRLPDDKKNFEDMNNRLDRIPACDRQTDGQTDILPWHSPRYVYASRGKNERHEVNMLYSLQGHKVADSPLTADNYNNSTTTSGGGTPPPHSPPPRRLRHIDPRAYGA